MLRANSFFSAAARQGREEAWGAQGELRLIDPAGQGEQAPEEVRPLRSGQTHALRSRLGIKGATHGTHGSPVLPFELTCPVGQARHSPEEGTKE